MIAWEKEKRDKLHRIMEKYSTADRGTRLPVVYQRPVPQEYNSNTKYGCGEVLDEFCNNSTIHGIKYMGDRKRNKPERIFWLIAFLISIYGCSRLILHIWQRWDRNPVIVSFAEKSTPIYQIPFPAVTICLETKSQSDLFNYTAMYHRIKAVDNGFTPNNFTEEE